VIEVFLDGRLCAAIYPGESSTRVISNYFEHPFRFDEGRSSRPPVPALTVGFAFEKDEGAGIAKPIRRMRAAGQGWPHPVSSFRAAHDKVKLPSTRNQRSNPNALTGTPPGIETASNESRCSPHSAIGSRASRWAFAGRKPNASTCLWTRRKSPARRAGSEPGRGAARPLRAQVDCWGLTPVAGLRIPAA
jgi:hypothetical protein